MLLGGWEKVIIAEEKEGRDNRRERRDFYRRGMSTRSLIHRQIFFGFGASSVFFEFGC